MAAVKLLVIEAMRKTVSAVESSSCPTTAVPTPRVWTSSPPTITPYATPGTGSLATNPSTSRSTSASASSIATRRTIAASDLPPDAGTELPERVVEGDRCFLPERCGERSLAGELREVAGAGARDHHPRPLRLAAVEVTVALDDEAAFLAPE